MLDSTHRSFIALMLSTFSVGCAFGNKVVKSVELPQAQLQTAQPRIVVSDFYDGKFRGSATKSLNIIVLRESMEVRDVSFEVAGALRQRGLNAVAKKNFDHRNLKPHEILLRGTRSNGPHVPKPMQTFAKAMLSSVTMFVIGTIISWPHTYLCRMRYSLEATDREGNFVLSSPDLEHTESFKTYGWVGKNCDAELEIGAKGHSALYDAIAASITGRRSARR